MKPATVAAMVAAIADWQAARASSAKIANGITALEQRVSAAESLLEVISDALLQGTTADPERRTIAPKKPAAKKAAKARK